MRSRRRLLSRNHRVTARQARARAAKSRRAVVRGRRARAWRMADAMRDAILRAVPGDREGLRVDVRQTSDHYQIVVRAACLPAHPEDVAAWRPDGYGLTATVDVMHYGQIIIPTARNRSHEHRETQRLAECFALGLAGLRLVCAEHYGARVTLYRTSPPLRPTTWGTDG